MSFLPRFGFDLFDQAAEDLRSRGYEIVSPAELDDPDTREWCLKSSTGDVEEERYANFLLRDLEIVMKEVDGVVVLPNWTTSRGARTETFVAHLWGKPIFMYNADSDIEPMDKTLLIKAWIGE